MEIMEDENTEEPQQDENIQIPKKKKVSMEVDEFLTRRKSDNPNFDFKRRRSSSMDKLSSKAYSFKCALDDSIVLPMLESPEGTTLRHCPSDNIGVRSMSLLDFPNSELLSELEATVFAEILREAADSLEILKRTIVKSNRKSCEPKTDVLKNRTTMRKKNFCTAKEEKDLIFGSDLGFVPVVPCVNDKLMSDRDLVHNVFRKVSCELEHSGSYDWLKCEVNAIIEAKEKENNLEVSLKIWSDLVKRMKDSEIELEQEFEMQKEQYMEEIKKLKADIDGSYCVNNERLDYMSRWEESKLEQYNLKLYMKEEALLNEMKEMEKSRKVDEKVSHELEAYGKLSIKESDDEAAKWTKKYNDELEKRQQAANELQEKIEETQEFLEQSREAFELRQVVVDGYMEEQRKIQKEIEYWEVVRKSATLIQTIWRGYMVRHRLGRFAELMTKPAKKKKSKKSKSKKSKK